MGDKIRRKREEAGLSQSELASKLGVSSQAVNMWESGARRPTLENVMAMAWIFACKLEDLVPERESWLPYLKDTS